MRTLAAFSSRSSCNIEGYNARLAEAQIAYNRATRLIERMESEGGANHVGKREVLARNVE